MSNILPGKSCLFSSPGEIKTPGDHHFSVDDHDLIQLSEVSEEKITGSAS
jgi:hypothetical protein